MLRIDAKVIADAIEIAKTTFVPGKKNAVIHSHPILDSNRRENGSVYDTSTSYDANQITPTIIAAVVPKQKTMGVYLQELMFGSKKVERIIALGSRISYFYEHCVAPVHAKPKIQTYQSISNQYNVVITPKPIIPSNQCTANDVKKSKLQMNHNELMMVAEATFITLHNENDVLKISADQMPLYWDLCLQSKTKNTVIQSADGGLAGHLILMIEIINNYAAIFASADPQDNAKAINNLLAGIREKRPGLVNTVEQFEQSVLNAHALYNFNLLQQELSAQKEKAALAMPPMERSSSAPSLGTNNYGAFFVVNLNKRSFSGELLNELDALAQEELRLRLQPKSVKFAESQSAPTTPASSPRFGKTG